MNKKLEGLSLEEKVGQLFVSGFFGLWPTEEYLDLIEEEKLGNVILFSHNISDKKQLACLNKTLRKKIVKETGIIPFISVDEEGGVVTRLPKECAIMPSAMAQSQTKDRQLIYEGARITAEQLKQLGINMNLAPVLDINSNRQNPVIGVRSFGECSDDVCFYAKEVMKAHKEIGILCSGKHFPGHGDTDIDSHLGLPVIEKSRKELERQELVPFKEMIRKEIPAITIAHIVVKALEPLEIPCTISKTVLTDYLRKELNYQGLIISDCMEMKAMSEYGTIEENVISALKAGIDLIFISHTPSLVKRASKAVREAVKREEITMEELDEKVARILKAKETLSTLEEIDIAKAGTKEQLDFTNSFLEKTIQEEGKKEAFFLGENPIFIGIIPSNTTNVSDIARQPILFADYLANKYGGTKITLSLDPGEEELQQVKESLIGKTSVVVGTLNGHLYEGQKKLLSILDHSSLPVALATLRNPYDRVLIKKDIFFVPLYEYSERVIQIFAEYLVQ